MDAQFRMIDSDKLPQQVRIQWARLIVEDEHQPRPDEAQDGFWPSVNPDDAGYIGSDSPQLLEAAWDRAEARMEAFENGEWRWIGVQARARVLVPIGGNSFAAYEFTSPGVWGTESDSDEAHLNEIYEEEQASLRDHLRKIGEAFADPLLLA